MTYDHDHDQWIVIMDQQPYGLHCGEHFQIKIGSRQLNSRLELDRQWYVIIENVRFDLKQQEHYQIIF